MGTTARVTTRDHQASELLLNWININSLFNLMGVTTPDNVIFHVSVEKPSGAVVKFPLADMRPPVSDSGDSIGFGFSSVVEDSNDTVSTITGFTLQ